MPVKNKFVNLGQWNLVGICIRYILTQRKKLQAAVTFRDNDIGFLRFSRHRNFQSSSKMSFFFLPKSLPNKKRLVSGQQIFARTSQRVSYTNKKNLMMLPLIWRLQWKYFQGSVYVARTVRRYEVIPVQNFGSHICPQLPRLGLI
jgi:hypothetical protein